MDTTIPTEKVRRRQRSRSRRKAAAEDATANRWRPPLAVIALLCAVLLTGWRMVMVGMSADDSASNRPVSAWRWDTRNPRAAPVVSGQLLAAGRAEDGLRVARRALYSNPIESAVVRSVGVGEILAGNEDRGTAVMGQAAALGWRDFATQIWVIGAAERAGDSQTMAERLDALLRSGGSPSLLNAMIAAHSGDEAFMRALADRLALDPPWRRAFFASANGLTSRQLSGRERLYAAMLGTEKPLRAAELADHLRLLRTRGQEAASTALWNRYGGSGRSARPAGLLVDGGFETAAKGEASTIFEWLFVPSVSSAAAVERRPSGAGYALHARTDSTSSDLIARQTLALPSGSYLLSVDVLGSASGLRAFSWWIVCRGGPTPAMTLMPGTPPDRPAWSFAIPSEYCKEQEIQLVSRRVDLAGPQEIWFDNLSISRRR